jgi:hypothetical protein
MLSPDHVRVRRKGNELKLLGLDKALAERAVTLAREVSDVAREHVGKDARRGRARLARHRARAARAPRLGPAS